MKGRFLLFAGIIFASFVFLSSFFSQPSIVQAAATHVVISEIQVGVTGHANDEFVELYNPTGQSIDISGWKLRRETQSGASTSANLVASMSGSIPAHGFFLITSPQSLASSSADMLSSATNHIAADNTVLLFDNTPALVDKVGMGLATDVETTAVPNPANGTSIERKASSVSTNVSMMIGGSDEFMGNGEDTDNNVADFVTRTIPQPQNSSSSVEPIVTTTPTISIPPTVSVAPTESPTPLPTMTSTPTPTVNPSPTPTIVPTVIPTNSPTPTMTITPTPTIAVTLTPTETPTLSPTPILTATPMPTITIFPTPTTMVTPTMGITAFPTPTPIMQPHPFPRFVCSWTHREIRFFGITITIPSFHCVWK